MKPWEVKKTREKMRKMSPQKSVEIFLKLQLDARKKLKATLRDKGEDKAKKKVKV